MMKNLTKDYSHIISILGVPFGGVTVWDSTEDGYPSHTHEVREATSSPWYHLGEFRKQIIAAKTKWHIFINVAEDTENAGYTESDVNTWLECSVLWLSAETHLPGVVRIVDREGYRFYVTPDDKKTRGQTIRNVVTGFERYVAKYPAKRTDALEFLDIVTYAAVHEEGMVLPKDIQLRVDKLFGR